MKAFLSHTSLDKDLVGLVHKKLAKEDAWYDASDIENGESIPDKINEGLRYATHYVLFWSKKARDSNWVRAELNAAFVQMMSNKCKFMIFTLDNTELPELLQPYKYENIDKDDLEAASDIVVEKILQQKGTQARLSEFINRTKELGEIEESVRNGYKLIILNGILGIGKYSLAEKAISWLYQNRVMPKIVIDFNAIPGIAELAIELSYKTKKNLINDNLNVEEQKNNIQYFLEFISASNMVLILKDVKNWLNEDGTMSEDLLFITDLIMKDMFSYLVIMTTSRYIELPYNYYEKTRQLPIRGMEDAHISQIIQNNLPKYFQYDEKKNFDFAKRLYGYPLGAKLGANYIANHGYDFYLNQPQKIQELKVGLAKRLISYAELSNDCLEYLKIIALCQSRLRNEEYIKAFPEFTNSVAKFSDEAFYAGILKYGDDGCYKLELLVEDYFYDLAFNDIKCKEYCNILEKFLLEQVRDENNQNYMRLIPVAVHILTLNGNITEAVRIRSELTSTVAASMWDLYNHQDYEKADKIAEELLDMDKANVEARYIKALCLTRFDEYKKAEEILGILIKEDNKNIARYYYALGRIQKRQGNYISAIELFQAAIMKKRKYLSPHRELAECYILLEKMEDAQVAIEKAKKIDDSNIFVVLIEARFLQKENREKEAIELLENQSLVEGNQSQILFRKGRAFDQIGEKKEAMKCYLKALEYNSKAYDAKLCLLNHQIIENPQSAEKEIVNLKGELRGKRKFILSNIEARFIGYYNNDEDKAIEILDSVPQRFRDRQWHAVKKQLLENIIVKHKKAQRMILVKEYENELEKLNDIVKCKYGDAMLKETDLLPDA